MEPPRDPTTKGRIFKGAANLKGRKAHKAEKLMRQKAY